MERKARRARRYIYPQNISVFYLIWLSAQRTGFIEFIINFSRTAILSRHIPLPILFEVGTPFLPPVSRKSCANGCSAISARGRNQMNARWMPQGKLRGVGGMGFGVMCLKIGSKEGIRVPFSILDVPFRQFYGMFHHFFLTFLVNHLRNDDRSLIAPEITLMLQSIGDVDARSITTRLCGQQTKHYLSTLL